VPSGAHDTTLLGYCEGRIGMNCSTSIEKARSKELSSNGKARASACPEADPRVGIADTREIYIGFGQINSGDARNVGNLREGKCQDAGPAADIEHAVAVRKANELYQEGRESATPPSHDLFVGRQDFGSSRQRRYWDWASLNSLSDCRGSISADRPEHVLAGAAPPVHPLTGYAPIERLRQTGSRRFEGAGSMVSWQSVSDAPYRAGERTMIKVKHERTADCLVAGCPLAQEGCRHDDRLAPARPLRRRSHAHHVGVAAAFTATVRKQLVVELTPLRADALEDHPWRDRAVAQEEASAKGQRLPGATSRWNRGKDLSWEPLRPERVCEVAYDHMQGTRFRHAAKFLRLASRQAPAGLPLRSAGSHARLRAGPRFRRARP